MALDKKDLTPLEAPAILSDDEKGTPPSTSPTLYDEKNELEIAGAEEEKVTDDYSEYVQGWKLSSLMISITLAAFLMLLDMSIIVTVCCPLEPPTAVCINRDVGNS